MRTPALTLTLVLTQASLANVDIFDGQTLTEADLLAGSFMGQSFTLGPETEFNFFTGGSLSSIGVVEQNNEIPFDLRGSTFNFDDGFILGGHLVGSSSVVNATLNFRNSESGNAGLRASNSTINQIGGRLGSVRLTNGSSLHVQGDGATTLTNSVRAFEGSTAELAGSDTQELVVRGGTVHLRSGSVDFADLTESESHDGHLVLSGEDATIFRLRQFAGVAELHAGSIEHTLTATDVLFRMTGGSTGTFVSTRDIFLPRQRQARSLFFGGSHEGQTVFLGTSAVLAGGSFNRLQALLDADIELRVTELRIDGVPIDLIERQTIIIPNRNGELLEATLADGSPFDLDLEPLSIDGVRDVVSAETTLRVTLVPAPATTLLAAPLGIAALRRRR